MSEDQPPAQNALKRWWSNQPKISRVIIAAALAVGAMRLLWGFRTLALILLLMIVVAAYFVSRHEKQDDRE